MNKRMRVPPSGPLIVDPVSGAGPLGVGDGTPGRCYRAQGIRLDANQLFTGADQLLQWQDLSLPLGTGPALTTLDWYLPTGYLWHLQLSTPIRNIAAAASSAVACSVTARNIATGVRETLYSETEVTPANVTAINLFFPALWEDTRLAPPAAASGHDQVQVTMNSPAQALYGVITDLLSMRLTQYAAGSL